MIVGLTECLLPVAWPWRFSRMSIDRPNRPHAPKLPLDPVGGSESCVHLLGSSMHSRVLELRGAWSVVSGRSKHSEVVP